MLANDKILSIIFLMIAFILLFAGTRLYNISLKDIFINRSIEVISPIYNFSFSLYDENKDFFESNQIYEIEQKLEISEINKSEIYDVISRYFRQKELAKFFNKKINVVYSKSLWELTYFDFNNYNFHMPITDGVLVYNEYYYPGALRKYRNGIHQGVDLSFTKSGVRLPKGAPIYSISEGIVVKITDYKYYSYQREYFQFLSICANQRHTDDRYLDLFRGKQVQVKYKNLLIIYCHLDQFNNNLKVGYKVDKGTIIGYMGNSGVEYIGSSPHLHLEIYLNNFPIVVNRERNPFDYEYQIFSLIFTNDK